LERGKEKKEGLRPSKTPYNLFGASPPLTPQFKRALRTKASLGRAGGKKNLGVGLGDRSPNLWLKSLDFQELPLV